MIVYKAKILKLIKEHIDSYINHIINSNYHCGIDEHEVKERIKDVSKMYMKIRKFIYDLKYNILVTDRTWKNSWSQQIYLKYNDYVFILEFNFDFGVHKYVWKRYDFLAMNFFT